MKTYKTMLSEQLTPFQLAKARMDYEDSQKPYKPVEIPKMKYPKAFKNETVGSWNFIKGCLMP